MILKEKDYYHNIDEMLEFHYKTMHLVSNMTSNSIKRSFKKKDVKREPDIKLESLENELIDINNISLVNALNNRRTQWPMNGGMTLKELLTVLTYSFGVSKVEKYGEYEVLKKRYPSAGAEYSIGIYIHTKNINSKIDGKFLRYSPEDNGFYIVKPSEKFDINDICSTSKFTERQFDNTPLNIFFVADFSKLFDKYGLLTYRLSFLEAGHMSQNVQLISQALNLKSVPLGGFYDLNIEKMLSLKENEYCIYVMGVGK